jgi:transposase
MRGRVTAITLTLSAAERQTLRRLERTLPPREQRRLRSILLFSRGGVSISDVSRQVGLSRRNVYKWIERYKQYGVDGLLYLPRTAGHERSRDD